MEYLSVCSGIEAASVAWHPLGWKAMGFAEIEPFPRAVLQHHYPDVPLHGDFTKLITDPVAADVLVGGTPCQAFSIAGKRASLDDARGNLSLAFIELANAIDNLRRDRGQAPCIVLWENVPGVFSVADNAFGCFLAGLVGEDTPIEPAGGKWTDAGLVAGPQRTAAWRTLDAQFFGLAQRRERVFVVASAREGFDPAAVLFEPEGMRRHSPPRRQTGERPAPSLAARTRGGGGLGTDAELDGALIAHALKGEGFDASEDGTGRGTPLVPAWPAEVACTLNTKYGEKMGLEDQHALGGAPLLKGPTASGAPEVDGHHYVPMVMSSGQANAEVTHDHAPSLTCLHEAPIVAQPIDEVADPLTANSAKTYTHEGTGNFRLSNCVMQPAEPLPFDETQVTSPANRSNPKPGDPSHPLAKGARPPTIAFTSKDYGGDAVEDISPTLRAMPHDGSHPNGGGQVAVAFHANLGTQGGGIEGGDKAPPLRVSGEVAVAFAMRGREDGAVPEVHADGETASALRAASGGSTRDMVAFQTRGGDLTVGDISGTMGTNADRASGGAPMVMQPAMHVRRLTPEECEALQGFPRLYTRIPWRGKPADQCPDGPRYKALGNSMATPCMRWLGERIQAEVNLAKETDR